MDCYSDLEGLSTSLSSTVLFYKLLSLLVVHFVSYKNGVSFLYKSL